MIRRVFDVKSHFKIPVFLTLWCTGDVDEKKNAWLIKCHFFLFLSTNFLTFVMSIMALLMHSLCFLVLKFGEKLWTYTKPWNITGKNACHNYPHRYS